MLTIVQGATFACDAQFQDGTGAPVSVAGCAIRAQVRDVLGNLVATLTVTASVADPATVHLWGGATLGWPVGRLVASLYVVGTDSVIRQTETIAIMVQPAITLPATT